MKLALALFILAATSTSFAQQWKTLPKGVRILGYRNVTTSKINSNFNQFRSESSLGPTFQIDANLLNNASGNTFNPGAGVTANAFNALTVGEYKVDANAQANVQGTGFGIGLTDRIMFYAEFTYYNAQVNAKLKRTKGNTYKQAIEILRKSKDPNDLALAENLGRLYDINENAIQSFITSYGYKPIGTWQGQGYGDMETGVMANVIDRSTWGLLLYTGAILPTGKQDDPDVLQDIGFGDGQTDVFSELGTGYIFNDRLKVGTTLRYTYQIASEKNLRVQQSENFTLSKQSGNFNVKYGNRLNWMFNTTYSVNDWISFTPVYRFMYQGSTQYDSEFTQANKWMAANTDKYEHQVQLTTTLSSITPFLKKQFVLPAQININAVQTVAGKNVAKIGRFEVELRMLF